jgi:ABC-type amino acid transport substrate-binding protein
VCFFNAKNPTFFTGSVEFYVFIKTTSRSNISDGSWNGMVDLLAKEKIDIAVTDFTVTMARSSVITFAQPITQIHHRLFIKNPSGETGIRGRGSCNPSYWEVGI